MSNEDKIVVSEDVAKKLEALGVQLEVVFVVPRDVVEALASLLGDTAKRVSRKSKTTTRKSPVMYIKLGRVTAAKEFREGSSTRELAMLMTNFMRKGRVYNRAKVINELQRLYPDLPIKRHHWAVYQMLDNGTLKPSTKAEWARQIDQE